jgi:hypothetical protein
MGASHHSEAEIAAQQRFIAEMLATAKPAYPQGRLNADDLGETAFAVAADLQRKVVIIRFTKPIDWLGLHADETRQLANLLLEKAAQLEAGTAPQKG